MTSRDFSMVSEIPGSLATREQVERLYHRYYFAAEHSKGKRVLEVACGSGIGLGYLGRTASLVIGGDATAGLLKIAQTTYGNRIPLLRLDAQRLPFAGNSFDVVVMMEAIYYLPDAEVFIAESARVLNKNGLLVLSTVNKDWVGLSRSTLSTRYLSVPELGEMIQQHKFERVAFFGGFVDATDSPRQRLVALIRQVAATLDLVPRTLKGRAWLKRLFYGTMQPLPHEVTAGMTTLPPYEPLDASQCDTQHKIIYMVALR